MNKIQALTCFYTEIDCCVLADSTVQISDE